MKRKRNLVVGTVVLLVVILVILVQSAATKESNNKLLVTLNSFNIGAIMSGPNQSAYIIQPNGRPIWWAIENVTFAGSNATLRAKVKHLRNEITNDDLVKSCSITEYPNCELVMVTKNNMTIRVQVLPGSSPSTVQIIRTRDVSQFELFWLHLKGNSIVDQKLDPGAQPPTVTQP